MHQSDDGAAGHLEGDSEAIDAEEGAVKSRERIGFTAPVLLLLNVGDK